MHDNLNEMQILYKISYGRYVETMQIKVLEAFNFLHDVNNKVNLQRTFAQNLLAQKSVKLSGNLYYSNVPLRYFHVQSF